MKLSLSKKEFIARCKNGKIPVISHEIPFNKPSDVYERIMCKNSILLESARGPERIARYSFIAIEPYLEYRVKNGLIEIISHGGKEVSHEKPLGKLKEILGAYPHEPDNLLPPFQGGAIGLISYDFVHYLENIPRTVDDDLLIPDAHFLITDKTIAFDHGTGKAWIIICPGASTGPGWDAADLDYREMHEKAETDIFRIYSLMETGIDSPSPGKKDGSSGKIEIVYEMDKDYYIEMAKRTKYYIKAGDIFQANLSQRVSSDIRGVDPWEMYRRLSAINPSPFAAFVNFEDYCIAGSSPERLVKLHNGTAETRPIAGTRPRGGNFKEDEDMRRDLILNKKERAEHIMLIDLERNDLGKVCGYGTVEADELMITEDYSHVIHIVSNVTGKIAPQKDGFDLIRAVFPGGTITGVPKVRCMEIIDELEPVARGPYTGSVGYIGFSGDLDLNIVIRTFVCKDNRAYVHAGAGIVADSDPEREYQETLKKAEALIKTLSEVR